MLFEKEKKDSTLKDSKDKGIKSKRFLNTELEYRSMLFCHGFLEFFCQYHLFIKISHWLKFYVNISSF